MPSLCRRTAATRTCALTNALCLWHRGLHPSPWAYFQWFYVYQQHYNETVVPVTACPGYKGISTWKISTGHYIYFAHHTEYWLSTIFIHTSYVTPLSVPASQGVRSATSFWTQPQSLVQRSSPDSPTFQSGLGPSMVRKDIRWWIRSTENSADGAVRLMVRPVDNDKYAV